jgi:hypothetical protein
LVPAEAWSGCLAHIIKEVSPCPGSFLETRASLRWHTSSFWLPSSMTVLSRCPLHPGVAICRHMYPHNWMLSWHLQGIGPCDTSKSQRDESVEAGATHHHMRPGHATGDGEGACSEAVSYDTLASGEGHIFSLISLVFHRTPGHWRALVSSLCSFYSVITKGMVLSEG